MSASGANTTVDAALSSRQKTSARGTGLDHGPAASSAIAALSKSE
jgi:hypothetical protein